jgi:hypothetical protein
LALTQIFSLFFTFIANVLNSNWQMFVSVHQKQFDKAKIFL